ncbi:MAG: hypothetical protein WCE90_05120 [Candidatus Zixiibacteriota bacterium]
MEVKYVEAFYARTKRLVDSAHFYNRANLLVGSLCSILEQMYVGLP